MKTLRIHWWSMPLLNTEDLIGLSLKSTPGSYILECENIPAYKQKYQTAPRIDKIVIRGPVGDDSKPIRQWTYRTLILQWLCNQLVPGQKINFPQSQHERQKYCRELIRKSLNQVNGDLRELGQQKLSGAY
ncbi:MAG: hypothetical protein K9N46_02640 [Candidatus Marinimicrobia bacterium]|nr:hypothetical protein [Candidatus Neomarinimicrobiota bacterium]MCF7828206.1 hypothetical protein [Candidatus Neomarinimicrobiota bacterium]MCF7879619.1 hypothetical protein [Candidatus Neomarinimicrobiota bacterium]